MTDERENEVGALAMPPASEKEGRGRKSLEYISQKGYANSGKNAALFCYECCGVTCRTCYNEKMQEAMSNNTRQRRGGPGIKTSCKCDETHPVLSFKTDRTTNHTYYPCLFPICTETMDIDVSLRSQQWNSYPEACIYCNEKWTNKRK